MLMKFIVLFILLIILLFILLLCHTTPSNLDALKAAIPGVWMWDEGSVADMTGTL
jgi:hypothetical protein